jgi:hypothetical protein
VDLVLGRGAFRRERGAFVPWRQKNCLLEPTPTDEKQYNLLSRPPLIEAHTWGAGPIHGTFQRDGLFNGDLFAVSGNELYRNGISLGAIDGTGPVSWAGGNAELVVTRGTTAYSYDGSSLAAIVTPDGFDVRAVNWVAGWFFYVRDGSGRFYWSDLNDGRTIDALSFANAESSQDNLLDILKVGDLFWMLGAASGEAWILTGDAELPVTRVAQRTLECGIRDTGCGREVENTVFFVSNDGMVRHIQEAAVRISDSGLEERIRQSATCETFYFSYEGKALFCLRLDSGTWALDLSMQNQPVELGTYGRSQWAPKCAVNVGADAYFGDDTDGTIWRFGTEDATDSGAEFMERIFTAGLPIPTQPLSISNVIVDGNTGATTVTDPAEQAAEPLLEMRHSRDGGYTFSPWRSASWGAQGERTRRARFGGCGMFAPPGFLAEFRFLPCVPLRVASVKANEPLSGRGW